MVGAVAGHKAPDEPALEAEFVADFHPRPDFDLRVVLGGQPPLRRLPALRARCEQGRASPWAKIAGQPFLLDDLLEPVPIAHGEREDQRCLAPGVHAQHLTWDGWVTTAQEVQAFAGQAVVSAYRILRLSACARARG